ncbi:MAG: pyruvate ferredoxin oxidoreductase [Patescibacteria group bacterium]|jgi:pyruvate ferredoxin oxidoreductase alpha subunit
MTKNNFKTIALTGGEAAAEAMRQINPAVFSAYPITPQTPIIEKFAKIVEQGLVETKFISVESEHSAMSLMVGAAAAGGRAMTATSSQGLALMIEILPITSGLRLPVVMNLAMRSISAPLNIHNDHQDAMLARDLGWIQIFCENNQEVYENNFLAVRLAENSKVKLPVMVCQDGFIASHNLEGVKVYDDKIIKNFVGDYTPENYLLNLKKPLTIGAFVMPDYYFEIKKQVADAMNEAKKVYLKIGQELKKITGNNYGYFEQYFMSDAKAVIVAMGSVSGTAKAAVDKLRSQGKKVGLLKINLYRPFPYQEVEKVLNKIKFVGILERVMGCGSITPLTSDISECLNSKTSRQTYILGLGGRDVQMEEIEGIFNDLLKGKLSKEPKYVGLKN